jgi:hypothetical protein
MGSGIGGPTRERVAGVGPSVPVISPGGNGRDRREQERRPRRPRGESPGEPDDPRPTGDDGSAGPDPEEHRVDIVV